MKVGDNAIMEFHCAGVVSEEDWPINEVNGDIVTLETSEDPDEWKKFNTKTGKCLNDNTAFGAWRTLKI